MVRPELISSQGIGGNSRDSVLLHPCPRARFPLSLVLIDWRVVGTLEESAGLWWCARPLLGTLGPASCLLFAFRPLDPPPNAQTPDRWPCPLGAPVPEAIQMQQLGNRTKWRWKIAPEASYLRHALLCFVFSICRCPRTQASAAAQLHGEMAWPRARVLRQVVGLWRLLHAMGR